MIPTRFLRPTAMRRTIYPTIGLDFRRIILTFIPEMRAAQRSESLVCTGGATILDGDDAGTLEWPVSLVAGSAVNVAGARGGQLNPEPPQAEYVLIPLMVRSELSSICSYSVSGMASGKPLDYPADPTRSDRLIVVCIGMWDRGWCR